MEVDKTSQQTYTYATLQETNCDEHESWLTFIRWQGNEEALTNLRKQLESINWHCENEEGMLSAFDLDTDFLVSEQTAKEITKLNLNAYTLHRKFDGKLKNIELGLIVPADNKKASKKEKINTKNIKKVNAILGYCGISDFLTEEDINSDAELVSNDSEDESQSDSDECESNVNYSQSEEEEEKKITRLPECIEKKNTKKQNKKKKH